MPILIILSLLALIFILVHYKSGIKLIIGIIPYSVILMGGVDKAKFSYFLEPSDWVLIITLTSIILFCLYKKRQYLLLLNFIDAILLSYLFLVIILPLSFHTQNSIGGKLFEYFIPIRLYVAYKLFYFLFCEYLYHTKGHLEKKEILYIFFIPGIISGIIGLINILPFNPPYLKEIIRYLYPLPQGDWYRLWGTNGGTNAAGNLFSILFMLSTYYYYFVDSSKKHLMFFSIFFFICILSSGSFSSLGGLIITGLLYVMLYINFHWKTLIKYLIPTLFTTVFIISITTIGENITKRFYSQFYHKGNFQIIPFNLSDRGYWAEKQLNILYQDNKLLWGMGPSGLTDSKYKYAIDPGSESFYMELILKYGILSIFWFTILILILLMRIRQAINENEFPDIFFPIISFYLVAGFANLTFHYGALIELFGYTLALLGHRKYLY